MAGPLGVTHFLILSKTETNVYLVSGTPLYTRSPPFPSLLSDDPYSDDDPQLPLSHCDFWLQSKRSEEMGEG